MKDLVVSEDIVSIVDFKRQASKLFRRVNQLKRPVVVTHNGSAYGVVIPPEEYDRLCLRCKFVEAVQEGLRQCEAAPGLTSEEVDRILDMQFGRLDADDE